MIMLVILRVLIRVEQSSAKHNSSPPLDTGIHEHNTHAVILAKGSTT